MFVMSYRPNYISSIPEVANIFTVRNPGDFRDHFPFDSATEELRKRVQNGFENLILNHYDFALENMAEISLWRFAFYNFVKEGRDMLRRKERRGGGLEASRLHHFLTNSISHFHEFFLKLCKQFGVSSGLDNIDMLDTSRRDTLCRVLIYTGDLSRYREGAKASAQQDFTAAKDYYSRSLIVNPGKGNAHNQLAVLAAYDDDKLEAVYHYVRSLGATGTYVEMCNSFGLTRIAEPFPPASENMNVIFRKIRDIYLSKTSVGVGLAKEFDHIVLAYLNCVGTIYEGCAGLKRGKEGDVHEFDEEGAQQLVEKVQYLIHKFFEHGSEGMRRSILSVILSDKLFTMIAVIAVYFASASYALRKSVRGSTTEGRTAAAKSVSNVAVSLLNVIFNEILRFISIKVESVSKKGAALEDYSRIVWEEIDRTFPAVIIILKYLNTAEGAAVLALFPLDDDGKAVFWNNARQLAGNLKEEQRKMMDSKNYDKIALLEASKLPEDVETSRFKPIDVDPLTKVDEKLPELSQDEMYIIHRLTRMRRFIEFAEKSEEELHVSYDGDELLREIDEFVRGDLADEQESRPSVMETHDDDKLTLSEFLFQLPTPISEREDSSYDPEKEDDG